MIAVGPEADRNPARAHLCPRCGGSVYRVHRRFFDRLLGVFGGQRRRYRCRTGGCSWDGLLAGPGPESRPRARAVWVVAITLLLAVVLSATVYQIRVRKNIQSDVMAPTGASLPATFDPPQPDAKAAPSAPQHGCVWRGSGQQPYSGTFSAALVAAGLPSGVVEKLARMFAGQLVSDRLEITDAGIRSADHRRQFGFATKAMVLGETLCVGAVVDIPKGVKVGADLYELVGQDNRRYLVMVVSPGNNVAVLEEQAER